MNVQLLMGVAAGVPVGAALAVLAGYVIARLKRRRAEQDELQFILTSAEAEARDYRAGQVDQFKRDLAGNDPALETLLGRVQDSFSRRRPWSF